MSSTQTGEEPKKNSHDGKVRVLRGNCLFVLDTDDGEFANQFRFNPTAALAEINLQESNHV